MKEKTLFQKRAADLEADYEKKLAAFKEAGGEVGVKRKERSEATLLKLRTSDFRSRGVDLRFVSAFPGEAEVLYPPLTHLRPVRRADGEAEVHEHVMDDGRGFAGVEVVPSFG